MKPSIAITVGDFNGIGPEVVLKSVTHPLVRRMCVPVLVGPSTVFHYYAERLGLRYADRPFGLPAGSSRALPIVESSVVGPETIHPGTLSQAAGRAAAHAIETAVRLAMTRQVAAIVTAPVSKQALHLAGVRYPGQTEMVQALSHSPHVAMMLVSPTMRVGLVTIHLPLADVPRKLTAARIIERVTVLHEALRRDFGVRQPVLAVLALNPHGGEGGDLGIEEHRIILPALERLRRRGFSLDGPFPADGFFARYVPGAYDAVIAMYHDQGLIPLKMSAGGRAVNVSVGLRMVRTSPDHGTAFPLAGAGVADPHSMVEAIRLAVRIARTRHRHENKKNGV
jgi:4-hydroxythreonine-4-phosphate dehydrogenase